MKIGRCFLLLIATFICVEAAAYGDFENQGDIEKRLMQIQQSIAIRKAKHRLARRNRKSAPKISTVSFASYMSNNMDENPAVQPEQSAFKPKCNNHPVGGDAKAPPAPEVAVGEGVSSGGNAVVRGPASESPEATTEPVQGY